MEVSAALDRPDRKIEATRLEQFLVRALQAMEPEFREVVVLRESASDTIRASRVNGTNMFAFSPFDAPPHAPPLRPNSSWHGIARAGDLVFWSGGSLHNVRIACDSTVSINSTALDVASGASATLDTASARQTSYSKNYHQKSALAKKLKDPAERAKILRADKALLAAAMPRIIKMARLIPMSFRANSANS